MMVCNGVFRFERLSAERFQSFVDVSYHENQLVYLRKKIGLLGVEISRLEPLVEEERNNKKNKKKLKNNDKEKIK